MITVGVEITGMSDAMARLAGADARTRNLQPAFEVIADLLELHVGNTFATQGAAINRPWAPLRTRTVDARARRWGYYGHQPVSGVHHLGPILVWTGRTRDSFRHGYPEHVRVVSSATLIWGSSRAIAQYHQRGGVVLPQRTILGFRDDFQKQELIYQPLKLYLQGVPPGAIRTLMQARLRF